MFRKVLVANRGEIAVRTIRACRDLGVATVAVYSEADRGALHTRMADEAFLIGPAPAAESYLSIDRVIDVARRSGCDAVHPGYGFLAENSEFAAHCEASGVRFIGPSAASIAMMGSKIGSRRAVSRKGIPVVPGATDPVDSDGEAHQTAARIGYPVIVKASAGGGGKGMRLVAGPDELAGALRAARAESGAAFGDETIYIEKLLERPRHIEIQVLADHHGKAIHLGERECSIQRRHQKVIEESPSPIMDTALREAMGDAALKVVEVAGYTNAGTVEFLLDRDRRFYFLEMNTRLQVEHAITEAVTGVDLVVSQLQIASGGNVPLSQDEVRLRGAAIECRIYAEDPEKGFLPSPGRVYRLQVPSGPGIRDDTGIYPGWTVPVDYDSLLSKLVAWGATRDEAIRRMRRALGEYRIDGISNTIGFFKEVLKDPDFITGDFDTGFIDAWRQKRDVPAPMDTADRDLALLAATVFESRRTLVEARPPASASNGWKEDGRRRQMRWR